LRAAPSTPNSGLEFDFELPPTADGTLGTGGGVAPWLLALAGMGWVDDPVDSKVELEIEDFCGVATTDFSPGSMTPRATNPSAMPIKTPNMIIKGDFMVKNSGFVWAGF